MSPERYRVRSADVTYGPHPLATLRDMASVRVFSDEAFIAGEFTDDWVPICAQPALRDAIFPPGRKLTLKEKNFVSVNTPASDPPPTIEEILRKNIAHQTAHEAPLSLEDRRPNRRRRDFIFLLLAGNGGIAALTALLPHNPVALLFALAFVVMFSLSAYWIMFHIMERY